MTAAEADTLHQALVDDLVSQGCIVSPAVEAAFRAVPRHHFLPDLPLERVYRDEAIPTHLEDGVPISSSSQPAAMAIMLEQLDLRPGQRVLEIGAGTGYNAALLAHVVGPSGLVVTVDLDEGFVAEARAHLAAAGINGIEVVCADGVAGYPARAPYDRIELTVGAWDVAPAWIDQLAPEGRLLLPLWLRGVQLTVGCERAVDPAGLPHLRSVNISGCSFMRLRGAHAGPEAYLSLGPDVDLTLGTDDRASIDPAGLAALLAGPVWDIDLPAGGGPGFGLWLALQERGFCDLTADEEADHPVARMLPLLAPGYRYASGLLSNGALCLRLPADAGVEPAEARPLLRCFAPDPAGAERVAHRYLAQLAAWMAAGRPSLDHLRLRVYPIDAPAIAPRPAVLVPKRWSQIAVDWVPEPGVA